ncbi:hypothetical protein DKX38_005213 [Salix brachista]|uniref:Serine-threonine/tyrosine-protein kinase catalytic domain-containing protein n=1 Tax=Salix brachista TaxID=2182728 RepID=A0A5N5NCZ4_9ROSI|nr:hypothetical protein DKX38_005213 [Salix brachista]
MAGEGETEFKTEVTVIGRTNHKNLVQLVGFCNEGQHRLLVYEYMSNGSLSNYIFGDSRPNWHRRMQIALDQGREIGKRLLERIQEGGIQANRVTLPCTLSACSHGQDEEN